MRHLIVLPLLATACAPSSPFAKQQGLATPQPGEAAVLVRLADWHPPVPSQQPFISMALSNNYLFFGVAQHGIYRMPKYGGTIDLVDGSGDKYPQVTVANERVLWTVEGKIYVRPVDGGTTSSIDTHGLQPYDTWSSAPPLFQADADYVYFGVERVDAATLLYRSPIGGGVPALLVTSTPPPLGAGPSGLYGGPYYIADGGDVFFNHPGALELDVIRAGSGMPEVLASWPSAAARDLSSQILAVDHDNVYLDGGADATGHVIVDAVPRGGGAPSPIQLPLDSFIALVFAVDSTSFYFVGPKQGNDTNAFVITSMLKSGGSWMAISRTDDQFEGGPDPPTLQDEKNLFLMVDGGEIVMLPKTPIGAID
jgi:hypothetical protein